MQVIDLEPALNGKCMRYSILLHVTYMYTLNIIHKMLLNKVGFTEHAFLAVACMFTASKLTVEAGIVQFGLEHKARHSQTRSAISGQKTHQHVLLESSSSQVLNSH
jgi:hypothetical protein